MGGQYFPLLELPAELRFKIYNYICPEPLSLPQVFDSSHALRLLKQPLLQTSRRLRADVLHHQYISRVVTVFINSPCHVGFDFLSVEVAYTAITRLELLIVCSLEDYRDEGRQIILSDYQQRQLEAAFNFTDSTQHLKSVTLSCSVFRGIMQFPRRPELFKRFQDLDALSKLSPYETQLEWVPSSAVRVYPDPDELARATAACEAGLLMRLPGLLCMGIRCRNSCCVEKSRLDMRRLQTSSTFGRRLQTRQRTNGMF